MLFVLAFDHRNSLRTAFFGIQGEATPEQHAMAREAKLVIVDGLLSAVGSGLPAGRPGVLVDDEYGVEAARRARAAGVAVAMPVEQSGRRELEFEHSPFYAAIEPLKPDYVKVLVRYNPNADAAMNRRQREKMLSVQEWAARNRTGFMLELLVPPESEAPARPDYDTALRPRLTLAAVKELIEAGLRPELWKLEGMGRRAEYAAIAREVLAARSDAGCLVLGRGEDEAAVGRWLKLAAPVPGFAGFAVGRTIWWQPLRAYFDGTMSRDEAVHSIGANYLRVVRLYVEAVRSPVGGAPPTEAHI